MDHDLQLVRAAKRGDTDAFAKLYGTVYQDMYRFALYILCHPADAEDAVSETVVEAFVGLKKLKADELFKNWIFKILSNRCKAKLREYCKKNEELTQEILEGANCREEGPEEAALCREMFFSLDQEERMIVGLHLFCGYKSREIAELLHMNENTLRSKESRAIRKLGQNIQT